MQATINIDDRLIEQAAALANIRDSERLIELALNEFIQHHQAGTGQTGLLALFGSGGIREDYDYKSLRAEDGKECI